MHSDRRGGSKWVFYDYISGQMAHGERFIDGAFGDQVGWMYFDDYTGEVVYGWKDLPGKRVFYDRITGPHGAWLGRTSTGSPITYDEYTGAPLDASLVFRREPHRDGLRDTQWLQVPSQHVSNAES